MLLIRLLEKYGFLLVILFCIGAIQPALYSKISMMETNLESRVSVKSGSNALKQIFWIFLFFFYVYRVAFTRLYKELPADLLKNLGVLLIICFLALISVFWSDFPSHTLKRAFFQIIFSVTVVLSFYFSYRHGSLRNIVLVTLVCTYVLILVSIMLGGGFTPNYSLAGFAKGKNVMGINIAVILVLFHFLRQRYQFKLDYFNVHLGVLFFLIILTQSKTSILLVITYFCLIRLNYTLVRSLIGFFFLSLSFVFVLLPFISSSYGEYITISDFISEDFLTGRGMIWDTLYYDLYFFDKYNLGYGYGAYFGTPVTPYFFDDPYSFLQFINSPHNGFLDLLLQFGVIFTSLILLLLMLLFKNIKCLYITSALFLPLVHNITEASFFKDNTMIWLVFIVAIAASSLTQKRYGFGKN